jgi:hypothetical protein
MWRVPAICAAHALSDFNTGSSRRTGNETA